MPMSFADRRRLIRFGRDRAALEDAWIRSETHRAAFVYDGFLVEHDVDDRMCRVAIELDRVCPDKPTDVPCKFDDRELHAETDAEERHLVFTRVTNRVDLSFGAAITKTTRNQDRIEPRE